MGAGYQFAPHFYLKKLFFCEIPRKEFTLALGQGQSGNIAVFLLDSN